MKSKKQSIIVAMVLIMAMAATPASKVNALVDESNESEIMEQSEIIQCVDESKESEVIEPSKVIENTNESDNQGIYQNELPKENIIQNDINNIETRGAHGADSICLVRGSTIQFTIRNTWDYTVRICKHEVITLCDIYHTRNYVGYNYKTYGAPVSVLQASLNGVGYRLELDGRFGPNTHAALIDFQRTAGLSVDGIAGANTWKALNSRLPNF